VSALELALNVERGKVLDLPNPLSGFIKAKAAQ
jgi:hypothetical protein